MYRMILVGTFLALLALTLACAGLALFGAQSARYQLERTHLAHQTLEAHKKLDALTYSLFKQLTDTFLSPDGASRLDEALARDRLSDQLRVVREAIEREVAFIGDPENEAAELNRLDAIERQIGRVLDQFESVEAVIRGGGTLRDAPLLVEVLERSIDEEFRALIDNAIADERGEVDRARQAAEAALAGVALWSEIAAVAAVLLSFAALRVLLVRLRRPLAQLMEAARAVGAGDLSPRVPVTSADELGELAERFNGMLDELTASRNEAEQGRRDLESAVRDRTGELAQANEALRRADTMRRRFLADISHDLRTPLTIIRGEAEVTLRGRSASTEDYRTALARVVEQATHTSRLVDDLLFVARAEGGEPRLEREMVAFERVVRRASADLEVVADASGVRIEVLENAHDAVVQGDPDRLRQLVMILLDNALRYSERGGSVEVALTSGPDGPVLDIVDHGIGIAEDEMATVFTRFHRGANAAARHASGTGLGLAMAQAIVHTHGGEIALTSRLGQGTKVSVRLPGVRKLRAAQ